MQMGDNIKALRMELGLSQAELASKIGVRADTFSRWERGIMEPHKAYRISLAKFFGISLRELMFPDDEDDKTIEDNTVKNSP